MRSPFSAAGSRSGKDLVAVDGGPVGILPGLVYYLLNKPAGVVTTADDPQGRPTVLDLVPASPRVFPVGRLDLATEGLLLLTNDGELAQLLAHPRFGVEKEYLAEVSGVPGPAAVRRLREGVELDGGRRPRRPEWQRSRRGCSALSSTRGATGRYVACARRSAIPSCGSSGPGSGR